MNHRASFGVETAAQFFDVVVKPQCEEFVSNNSSQRHALLAVIVLYHLFEWVHQTKFTSKSFAELHPSMKEISGIFEIARNITNGTKHFKNKVETRAQGGFSSGFSDAFQRPLVVVYEEDRTISADIIIRKLLEFWESHFGEGSGG